MTKRIEIRIPQKDERLAEFIGIMLGDGNICVMKDKQGKLSFCALRIAGNKETDKEYLINYVSILLENLFGVQTSVYYFKGNKGMHIVAYGLNLINFLISIGLKNGSKQKNKVTIPSWIFKDKNLLKACIRGIIDTDGCVYECGNGSRFPRINLCSRISSLKKSYTMALKALDFNPTMWMGKNLMIYRKKDIIRYKKEIGFSNPKHLKRFKKFYNCAPLV